MPFQLNKVYALTASSPGLDNDVEIIGDGSAIDPTLTFTSPGIHRVTLYPHNIDGLGSWHFNDGTTASPNLIHVFDKDKIISIEQWGAFNVDWSRRINLGKRKCHY